MKSFEDKKSEIPFWSGHIRIWQQDQIKFTGG